MPDFAYIARDGKGQKVTGVIAAPSERDAISLLSGKALFPVEVKAEKEGGGFRLFRGVSGQALAQLFWQMGALLRSGVPLLRTLEVVREQSSSATLKEVLGDVHAKVEEGQSLADAMSRHKALFGEMAINMARAGGEGGFLEDALERVGAFTEQQEDLKNRTIGAMAYPIFLTVVGGGVVFALIVFFVPMFGPMFDRLRDRGELPWMTDVLLGLSGFLNAWWPLIIIALIGAGVFYWTQAKTEAGRRWLDGVRFSAPLAGVIFQNLAVARFCRVLGTLLKNGVPILRALDISRQAAGNLVLSDAVEQASENISAGESLAAPLAASKRFPPAVVEMIAVAEESNTLDRVLVEIADRLETRTTRQLELLVRLLEPIMLLIMAAVVLCVVIALLLPVIKMSSAL